MKKHINEPSTLDLGKEITLKMIELKNLRKCIETGHKSKSQMNSQEQIAKRQQYLDEVKALNSLIPQIRKMENVQKESNYSTNNSNAFTFHDVVYASDNLTDYQTNDLLHEIEAYLSPLKEIRGMQHNGYEKMKKQTEKLLQKYSS